MKFEYAIKKGKDLIWLGCDAENESAATDKAREILKDRPGYRLYAGPLVKSVYKVIKVGRKSGRRVTLEKNLTEAEAQRVVARYPSSTRSMVCYTAQ